LCVRVEISGSEDAIVLRVKDGLRKAREELIRVLQQDGDREAVDGKLNLIGGEAEGPPGRVTHWERFVELSGESVEIGGKGHREGGRVGDELGD